MADLNPKKFFNDVRFQLAYGIFLMVLIPAAILVNAISTINRYNQSTDIALQRQALTLARVFYATTRDSLTSPVVMQGVVDRVMAANPDLLSVHILVPSTNGFRVLVSSNSGSIGREINFYYYDLAWQQKENQALATSGLAISSDSATQDWQMFSTNERFWLVSMPLFDVQHQRQALLSIQFSSELVNQLTDENLRVTMISLIFTVLVAILFLAVSTRLWGYATLYRKIKEVDQMKDDFISIASHELRTPITAIEGYVNMVLKGDYGVISEEIRHALSNTQFSVKRLADLIEDLLNVSRIEQGRMRLEVSALKPKPIVEETVNELMHMAQAKNLSLVFQDYSTDRAQVMADRDKMKQVLLNLVGNAIKYTLKGHVTVATEIKDNFFEVKIKDTGVGISAEAQKRLFEKFYRVQTKDTRGITGTGLGLWITKQLVEMMKGRIYIESIEGTGTQVTLRFPALIKKIESGK